jgi:hypothetical protein
MLRETLTMTGRVETETRARNIFDAMESVAKGK